MPHDLPKAYDPGAIESHWAEYWVQESCSCRNAQPGFGAGDLYRHLAATQRHRQSPHGTHAGAHRDRHCRALEAHVGTANAVAAGHRSRRHRDAVDGGAPARQRRQESSRHGPRSLHRARVGLARALWRRDSAADEAPGRVGGLVARVLHHGRSACRARCAKPSSGCTKKG